MYHAKVKGAKIIEKEGKTRKTRFLQGKREELREDKDLEFIKPREMDNGK